MEIGHVVTGTIESVANTHFIVNLENEYLGLVHISEVSDYYVSKISSMFKVEHEYDFLVISVNDEDKRLKLSWKQIVPRFQKDPFEFEMQETSSGFWNLKKNTEKEIEND